MCITILPTEIKNTNMSFKSLTLINSNTATNYTYIKINFYTKLPINYNTNMLYNIMVFQQIESTL